MSKRSYWLFKTEPEVYSIDDLAAELQATGMWEGVRSYQARNLLRDHVRVGDGVFIYHSRIKELGIAGTAVVAREGYPDPTQFQPNSRYHDPKSTPEKPRWVAVDVKLERRFARTVTLAELRLEPALAAMRLLQRGQRLSIQPVTAAEWRQVLVLSRRRPRAGRQAR